MKYWFVYMVRCRDGSLYTGITTDLTRRVDEHNHSKSAAAYTRSRRPVALVYHAMCNSRSDAAKQEAEIRKMNKKEKEGIISGSCKRQSP